jgi:Cu/Ag efflux pump CusA
LLVVYLVLAAQFESFVHPIVILVTVPLAITGAHHRVVVVQFDHQHLQPDRLHHADRHRVQERHLIVEFANQLRDRGVAFVDAIIQSSATRLRPVLMTSLCTSFWCRTADAGAWARALRVANPSERRSFSGTMVSLRMTLYVVPSLYLLIARNTRSPEYMSRLVDALARQAGPPSQRPEIAQHRDVAAITFDINPRSGGKVTGALSTATGTLTLLIRH